MAAAASAPPSASAYLTQADEQRLRELASKGIPQVPYTVPVDRRLVFTSKTGISAEQSKLLPDNPDEPASQPIGVLVETIAMDPVILRSDPRTVSRYTAGVANDPVFAKQGYFAHLFETWAVMLSHRTAMLAAGLRQPFCFQVVLSAGDQRKLRDTVRLLELDPYSYSKIFLPLYVSDSADGSQDALVMVEMVLDRMSPIGVPMSANLYAIGTERKLEIGRLRTVADKALDHLHLFLQTLGSAYAADFPTVLRPIRDLESDYFGAGRFDTRTPAARRALFLKAWQWLSEQYDTAFVADRLMTDPAGRTALEGLDREVETALSQRHAITTLGSQTISPYPLNAAERGLRQMSHPQILPSVMVDEYQRALRDIRSGVGNVKVLVELGLTPELVIQKAANFCIGRLLGASYQPYHTHPQLVALTEFGIQAGVGEADALIGKLPANTNETTPEPQWNTIAGLLLLHRALWPVMCPLPPPVQALLVHQDIILSIGGQMARHRNTKTGGNLLSDIVAGAQELFQKIVRFWGELNSETTARVHLIFAAIELYLKICAETFVQNEVKAARMRAADAPPPWLASDAERRQYIEVIAGFLAWTCGSGLKAEPTAIDLFGQLNRLVDHTAEQFHLLRDAGVPDSEQALLSTYHTTAMAWVRMVAEAHLNPTVKADNERWNVAIVGTVPSNITEGSADMWTPFFTKARADQVAPRLPDYVFSPLFSRLQARYLKRRQANAPAMALGIALLQAGNAALMYCGPSKLEIRLDDLPHFENYRAVNESFTARRPVNVTLARTYVAPPQVRSNMLAVLAPPLVGFMAPFESNPQEQEFYAYGESETDQSNIVHALYGDTTTVQQLLRAGRRPEPRYNFAQLRDILREDTLRADIAGYASFFLLGESLRLREGQTQVQASKYEPLITRGLERTSGNAIQAAQTLLDQLTRALHDNSSRQATRRQNIEQLVDIQKWIMGQAHEARTPITQWVLRTISEEALPTDVMNLVYARALLLMLRTFFGTAEEPTSERASAGSLSRFQAVEYLISRFFLKQTLGNVEPELYTVSSQFKELRENAGYLMQLLGSLISAPGTTVEQFHVFGTRSWFIDFYNQMIDASTAAQYFVMLNSVFVDRLSVARSVSVAPAAREASIIDEVVSAFSSLSIVRWISRSGPLPETTLHYRNTIAEDRRQQRLGSAQLVMDTSLVSPLTKEFAPVTEQLEAFLMESGSSVVLGELLRALKLLTGTTTTSPDTLVDDIQERVQRSLDATNLYRLTEEERDELLSDSLVQTMTAQLESRRRRRRPVTGFEADEDLVRSISAVFGQRMMYADAVLGEIAQLMKGGGGGATPINLFSAMLYALVWDHQNGRVFWSGVGDSSPLLVSFKVPSFQHRISAQQRFHSDVQTLKLVQSSTASSLPIEQQASSAAARVAQASDTVLSGLERREQRAVIFLDPQNVATVLARLSNLRDEASTKKANVLAEYQTATVLSQQQRATIDARAAQWGSLESRYAVQLLLLRSMQLMNVLEPSDRRQGLRLLLNSVPEFAKKIANWRQNFRSLSLFLPSLAVRLRPLLGDQLFNALVAEVQALSTKMDNGLPSNALIELRRSAQRIQPTGNSVDVNLRIGGEPLSGLSDAVSRFTRSLNTGGAEAQTTLESYLDSQTATASNILNQLDYWQSDTSIPRYEIDLVRQYALWVRDPFATSSVLPPAFQAINGVMQMRHERALEAIIRQFDEQIHQVAITTTLSSGAWRYVIAFGDLHGQFASQPSFVRASMESPNMELLTLALLQNIIDSRAGKLTLPVYTGVRTSGTGSGSERINIKLMEITKDTASAQLAHYRTNVQTYMKATLQAFSLVEVPQPATQLQLDTPLTKETKVAVDAAEQNLMGVLRTQLAAQYYRLIELSGIEQENELKKVLEDVTGAASKITDRLNTDMLLDVDVSPLDATAVPLEPETYNRWRVESPHTSSAWLTATPLQTPFEFGIRHRVELTREHNEPIIAQIREMEPRIAAARKVVEEAGAAVARAANDEQARRLAQEALAEAQKDLGTLNTQQTQLRSQVVELDDDYTQRNAYTVLGSPSIHLVGGGWLKSPVQAATREQVVRSLEASGAPTTWAKILAWQYAGLWSKPGAQPLVEPSISSSVRSGVLHLDERMAALVIRNARFAEAESIDAGLVSDVFKANAVQYYSYMRVEMLAEAIDVALSHTRAGIKWTSAGGLVRLGDLQHFDNYYELVLVRLFAFDSLVESAKRVLKKNELADATSYHQLLSIIKGRLATLLSVTTIQTEGVPKFQDAEELEQALLARAREVLKRRDTLFGFKQVAPLKSDQPKVLHGAPLDGRLETELSNVAVHVIRLNTTADSVVDLSIIRQQMIDTLASISLTMSYAFAQQASSTNEQQQGFGTTAEGTTISRPETPEFDTPIALSFHAAMEHCFLSWTRGDFN